MSIFEQQNDAPVQGFAYGWTAFLTQEGLDILLRTSGGESKGRLSVLDADGNLTGSMFEPSDATDNPARLDLTVTIVSEEKFELRCNNRLWSLNRPKGKSHYFAFLSQWPSKAEPVASVKEMLARLKGSKKA